MKTPFQPTDARTMALSILNQFEHSRTNLDLLMEQAIPLDCPMDARDLALTHALVFGVIRWRMRLDHIIGFFSKTPIHKIDPDILNILRMAVVQIEQMDRIPHSAVVNTSVEMAKMQAKPWVAKFVNGLLRNMLRNMHRVTFPDMEEDALASISARLSYPAWLIERWIRRLGIEETARMAEALNRIPNLCVRTNTIQTSREELRDLFTRCERPVETTGFAPHGLIFKGPASAVTRIPGFAEGFFQVQDEAAQLVTCMLDPRPGESILDACAGLGGKTGHIAMNMRNQGRIVAMDLDGSKLDRLQEGMKRLGISNVVCETMDAMDADASNRLECVDRILVDAPCSGLGVLKRNPDTKWSASRKQVAALHARQLGMLLNIAGRLKPNGLMVYAVCSLEHEENESVIRAFLDARPDFRIIRRHPGLSPTAASVIDAEGFLNTRPFLDRMDGFFAAALIHQQ